MDQSNGVTKQSNFLLGNSSVSHRVGSEIKPVRGGRHCTVQYRSDDSAKVKKDFAEGFDDRLGARPLFVIFRFATKGTS